MRRYASIQSCGWRRNCTLTPPFSGVMICGNGKVWQSRTFVFFFPLHASHQISQVLRRFSRLCQKERSWTVKKGIRCSHQKGTPTAVPLDVTSPSFATPYRFASLHPLRKNQLELLCDVSITPPAPFSFAPRSAKPCLDVFSLLSLFFAWHEHDEKKVHISTISCSPPVPLSLSPPLLFIFVSFLQISALSHKKVAFHHDQSSTMSTVLFMRLWLIFTQHLPCRDWRAVRTGKGSR